MLGDSYRLQVDNSGYPTLFTLSYATDWASFSLGAAYLDMQIDTIKSLTYADKVNIVTHSKGGLLARRFVTGPFVRGEVNQLIMCEAPNLGALKAAWNSVFPDTLVNVSNLLPLWPWTRRTSSDSFTNTENAELDHLNHDVLPGGIAYTTIWSNSDPLTQDTRTGRHPLFTVGYTFGHTDGDGVVPDFSQLGLQFDPNNPAAGAPLIPAFQGVAIQNILIPGEHEKYLESVPVMAVVAALLLG